jgi:hypothetical protein
MRESGGGMGEDSRNSGCATSHTHLELDHHAGAFDYELKTTGITCFFCVVFDRANNYF